MNDLPAPLRWTIQTVALALVYVAAGKVGQAMALPHTNVTVMWPPSGIALAAVLADKKITPVEAELFRAIGDTLDVPIPPLLGS